MLVSGEILLNFGLKYSFVCFREVTLDYLKLSHKMVRGIVKILISKLGVSLDDSKINPGCIVNMNHYPPFPNPELTVGVGRHSDFETITLCIYTVKEIGIVCKMGCVRLTGTQTMWR